MALQGKFVSDITREDILELVHTHVAEDVLIDFKEVIFHPTHAKPNEEIDDLLADLVAFANAFGGHIVVGIEDRQDRAWQLRPMPETEAGRIATKLKALAIQYIKPPIVPLEVVPFRMDDTADEWVVIIHIQGGQAKPHISSYLSQTLFAIRDGNRKRSMTVEEIRNSFLDGPQQSALAGIYRELQSVRALVEASPAQQRRWRWRFWQ